MHVFYEGLAPDEALALEQLAKLLYELRENRQQLLAAHGAADEADEAQWRRHLTPYPFVRQILRKWGIWLLLAACLWLTWNLFARADLAALWAHAGDGSMPFAVGFDIAIAMPLSWLPLIADYSRFGRCARGTFGGGVLGAVNEAGQHVGIQIFPADYGIGMLTLPVGGFLVLAALIAAMQWALARPKKDKEESK